MSTSAFSRRGRQNGRRLSGRRSNGRHRAQLQPSATRIGGAPQTLASFVDLPASPFTPSALPPATKQFEANPVADLIPDELFQVLRAHDLISEMGIRNYAIRRLYHEIREDESITTAQAMEKIQDAYPYLQLDTIRKIVYRIGPPANRKSAF